MGGPPADRRARPGVRGADGYVFSVATAPGRTPPRVRERGARRVRLTTSAQAEPKYMYVSMGFAPEPDPLPELRL